MKKKQRDYKMIVGMTILAAVFAIGAGGFWSTVGRQAELVKEEEALEEANAMSAIFVETGENLKLQVFVDLDNETIFTAPIPEEGIYNKKGKLIRDDVLENGDLVKIYGNGIMAESFPGQYNGVTKIQRTGRASLEEAEEYVELVESSMRGLTE